MPPSHTQEKGSWGHLKSVHCKSSLGSNRSSTELLLLTNKSIRSHRHTQWSEQTVPAKNALPAPTEFTKMWGIDKLINMRWRHVIGFTLLLERLRVFYHQLDYLIVITFLIDKHKTKVVAIKRELGQISLLWIWPFPRKMSPNPQHLLFSPTL